MYPLSVRPRHRVGPAVLACALVLGAGACGSKNASSPTTTTTTSPSPTGSGDPATTAASSSEATTTTTTAPGTTPEEAAVLAAYQGYWDTYLQANAEPVNPNHPGIERYYTGVAKERLIAGLNTKLQTGSAVRLPDPTVTAHRPKVTQLGADRATVEDCATDDSVLYQPRTGAVLNDLVETRLIRGDAVLVDGAWKFENTVSLGSWQGVDGCAAG